LFTEDRKGLEIYREYLDIAKSRGVSSVVTNLAYDIETNMSRLGSEERKEGGKRKLGEEDVVEKTRNE
jgi:N-acyl-L-homoserine lactone synthetase